MPPINTTRIRTRATEHIAVELTASNINFTLHTPGGFVPDEIHVRAASDIGIGGLFEVQSNMLPNHTLCVFDGLNNYNPTSIHLNTSRQSFNSSYDVTLWDVVNMTPYVNPGDFIMITFEFIRYA